MKKMVRCKVCGYVMDESHLKDVCPACGVPRTAFVEYKPAISQKREDILNLHLHPISIHFPEAIAVFTCFFLFLGFIIGGKLESDLILVNKALFILFPFTVMAGFASGIYDAKIRFKKLTPPVLKRKIYLGILLFITSILSLILIFTDPYSTLEKVTLLLLSLVNLGNCVVLGNTGGKLIDSRMPG